MIAAYSSGEVIAILGVLFSGIAGVVAAIFSGMAAIRAGQVATTVAAVHKDTIEVNAAVNHKETGMPSLVQRVIDQDHRGLQLANDLATDRAYVNQALPLIAGKLGVELPPAPAPVAPAPVILPHADEQPIRPVDIRDIPIGDPPT
jgi:hypothetical protein